MSVLTRRQLNRATLARQLLLERDPRDITAAVAHLVGLQAQIPNPPYIGLWVRLAEFQRNDLTQLMESRQIVRVPFLRSTLHLVTAQDYLSLRSTIQPALVRALGAFFGKKARGFDIEALVAAAKVGFAEKPLTSGEIKAILRTVAPDADGNALAYAVRTYLPQVQVPPGGTWGTGAAAYTTAEQWFGQPVDPAEDLRTLTCRYLAAFGPATIQDVQAWSGMTRLKAPLEALKPEVRVLRDETGKELLDLPDAPLPPEDVPVPPCFVPAYDNLLVSHANRTRIIADEDRSKVFLSAGRVQPTILVDGFVAGTWKTERVKTHATLSIEPFAPLAAEVESVLFAEGERLLRFIEAEAETYEVRV